MKRRRPADGPALAALARKALLPLIQGDRKVLKVLDKHGVHFCAGCYMTLSSPVEKVAAYHAVPDHAAFLRDLKKALDARKPAKTR